MTELTCTVDDCGRTVHVKKHGLCRAHYSRMRAYGDPNGGGQMRANPAGVRTDGQKTCTKCRELKPVEQFSYDSRSSDGRTSACRACLTAKESARRADNSDAYRKRDRERYASNPLPKLEQAKRWHENNREQVRATRRLWHIANRDSMRPMRQESVRQYRAKKRGATVGYVSLAALYATEHCYLCGESLVGGVHIDHIVPLSRGGAHSNANLRPTHAHCNLRKSDLLLVELDWYNGPTNLGAAFRMICA